jgi:DNA-binding NtrC family response regulator
MKTILIVDDEENMLAVLSMLFHDAGYRAVTARNGAEALDAATGGEPPHVIVSDFKMPDMDGLALLAALRRAGCDAPFVLVTAYGTVERAVEAMKLGAVDVITKPFAKEMLLEVVTKICRLESLQKENRVLRQDYVEPDLSYVSAAMRQVDDLLAKVGPAHSPVLITGESGTGKELVARTIHRHYCGGDGLRKPFVSVNCPAVPENLLESELFGYRRGAFTGAVKDFRGKVELAEGGTLFFDEIGDLPPGIQPKLLRLLENKTYEPLGSGVPRRVDVRIVCATNGDLKRMVLAGRFREDLFYRINTITVAVPPLRERREDVPALARTFARRYGRELGKQLAELDDTVLAALSSYPWPGNVRELKNVIERAVVLCSGLALGTQDLPVEIRESAALQRGAGDDGQSLLEQVERRVIREALEAVGWNVSEAARKLGVTRNTLRYRMGKHRLNP